MARCVDWVFVWLCAEAGTARSKDSTAASRNSADGTRRHAGRWVSRGFKVTPKDVDAGIGTQRCFREEHPGRTTAMAGRSAGRFVRVGEV
ncbi:hypothetical protein GCM10012319_68370 [Comamonas sp. KCTC 72670]|nr:hypothetical protein GCM10012319_68370 [Comamonas sp. KCTC 72670]